MFEDVVFSLAKKEKEQERRQRERNCLYLAKIFKRMESINFRTTWVEVSGCGLQSVYFIRVTSYSQAMELLGENRTFKKDDELQGEWCMTLLLPLPPSPSPCPHSPPPSNPSFTSLSPFPLPFPPSFSLPHPPLSPSPCPSQLSLSLPPSLPISLAMDKEDMLITFEDHIRRLEQGEEEIKRRDKDRERRGQRKNRDSFIVSV